jgi:RimJ/RimL family protein N-acetyltransferase
MAEMAAWVLQERPASRLHLWVLKANLEAQGFYEHLGGVVAGEGAHVGADGHVLTSLRYGWEYPRRLISTPVLETARLILKPLELSDADSIQALFPQWEIVRYLTTKIPWPYPLDGALTWCRDSVLPAVARGEEWMWTLRLKSEPSRLIGIIGLRMEEGNNRGFWVGVPWQGQRLMTEASEVVTDYWFNTLKFPVMRVPKAAVNPASRRISERQGMRIIAVEERDYVGGRFPTEVWEITSDEWNARR